MRRYIYPCLLSMASTCVLADTIDHFMNIANNIPQMEMKADQQSQTWARSARTVLVLTSESIAETLMLSNETAKEQGTPFFCIPATTQLTGATLSELIQQTYKEIPSQQSDKDKMTVSQVALLGLKKQYPCQQAAAANKPVALTGAWPGGQQTVTANP